MTKRVAIYARVSTTNHGQNPEVQLVELRQYCMARGWTIIEEVSDSGYSGASSARPGLKRLMELARARKVDAVIIVKLDRLFRSLKHLVNALDEFNALGIDFVSLKDSLDFSTPSGRLLFGVLACLAEFEKDLIRERTIAGLNHARLKGKRLGRPRSNKEQQIRSLRLAGRSYRQIANELGMSHATVYRTLGVTQKPIENAGNETSANQAVSGE